jgi:hypothetical protein
MKFSYQRKTFLLFFSHLQSAQLRNHSLSDVFSDFCTIFFGIEDFMSIGFSENSFSYLRTSLVGQNNSDEVINANTYHATPKEPDFFLL